MKPVASRVKAIQPSPTVRLGTLAKELQAKGERVENLSIGEPDFPTPAHIIEAAKRALDDVPMTKYVSSLGLRELREAIAEKSQRENGIPATADNVLVAPTKHCLFLAIMALVEPGDEVLMPDPGWVSYDPMTRLAGGRPVPVPAADEAGFLMTPDAIEEAITPRTKAVLVNSPSNPAGVVFSEDVFRGIADACRDHDLFLISDEIYEKIIYEGRHISPASLDGMFDRTITVHGFSKTYAMTGWRVGWLAAEKSLLKEIVKVQEQTITCVPGFVQRAARAALTGPTAPVEKMVAEFRARRDIASEELSRVPQLQAFRPGGAFYFFPRYDGGTPAHEVSERLLKEGHVAVTPGSAFGQLGEGHLRISYAASRETIRRGIRNIGAVLGKRSAR
ncbi:MAG: pyridoxal phosphate-dependent aminotransferase [Methanobacteriota archaeon]|nr:MAG: pyridoxal phosphate-dependent aminotransferase [Euryarchaeota archaeon]